MRTAEENRLRLARPAARARLEKHIRWLEEEEAELRREIEALVRATPELDDKHALLCSVCLLYTSRCV